MTYPFQVGETYANRIGSYEVVWIDKQTERMLVRYTETGDEQEVTVKIQARIWKNMRIDEQEAARQAAQEDARYQRGYGEAFTGLKDTDFKTSTEGTMWRSRAGLAGRVALLVSEDTPYTFVSWSIYRWPVAFLTHREDYEMAAFEMGSRKAKYTLEVDESYLHYGFYVEKGSVPMDHVWDWPRLVRKLKSDENLRSVVDQAEAEHEARFIGRMSKGTEHFHFANGLEMGAQSLWDEEHAPSLTVDERIETLESIPDDHWGEIYIIARMHKDQAIGAGLDVAGPVVGLFKTLLPVYEAVVR